MPVPVSSAVVPNVAFVNPALAALMPQYYLIRDALSGEPAVKAARTTYLPMPDPTDKSEENKARYSQYLQRAVFYNATRRTLQGLSGQVFLRDPVIELPAQIAALEKNVSGSGITLTQQAKKAVNYTLAYSRAGLHVDYPSTEAEGGVTVRDLETKRIRPTINLYSPMEIINWRVVEDGAEERLSLVVLLESFEISDDGFEVKEAAQFRVLKLENGFYTQEIWREAQPTKYKSGEVPKSKNFQVHVKFTPKGPDGNPMTDIPFKFIGAENNDVSPDNPAFYDLASLNLAHYRNSADYEESCYIVGQPTPVATGLTEDWVEKVLKGRLNFGSRGGIVLPAGATAELLQANENTMIKEAMDTKERQMVALGAKLVEQKTVQRTATEASQDKVSESSALTSSALNVQDAYVWALEIAAMFAGAAGAAIKFEINTDFDISNMTPEQQKAAVEMWQKGATTFEEMRAVLRKAGTATEDDEKAKQKIAKDEADALAAAAEAMGDTGGNPGGGNQGGLNNA